MKNFFSTQKMKNTTTLLGLSLSTLAIISCSNEETQVDESASLSSINNSFSSDDVFGGREEWKLNGYTGTLDVSEDDNGLEYEDDASFDDSHFYFEDGDYVVFRCYPGNPHSTGSTNPRSELREVIDGGDEFWDGTTDTERSMIWKFQVNDLPPSGKLAFGQIHENDDSFDDIIRVQADGTGGQTTGSITLRILGYVSEILLGSGEDVDFDFEMDTDYYFELTMANGIVTLYDLDDNGDRETTLFTSGDVGDADENYFKAGVYLQTTTSDQYDSDVYGQVSISELSVSPND